MSTSNIFKKFKFSFLLILILSFCSCGYKASSAYAKKELGDNIFVALNVNINNPKNSVIIKDTFNELLINKLGKNLVYKKDQADTIVYLDYKNVSFTTLSYDDDGYSNLYKVIVNLNVKYAKKGEEKKSFTVKGRYDFSADSEGTISETKKFDAIKTAFEKALEEVISKLAIASYK